jgi:anti-sigma regulatory factor (Ser/Thr protein kinase)
MKISFFSNLKKYHFEWKHLLVLFIVLIFFQFIVSYIHKISLQEILLKTQDWYKQDSAEKLANLTTTSLELLLETSNLNDVYDSEARRDMIQAFNIILSQQLLQQNVEQILILVDEQGTTRAIDSGEQLYNHLFLNEDLPDDSVYQKSDAAKYYADIHDDVRKEEQIYSIRQGTQTFHVFVPLVPHGEFAGAVYMKIVPDFSFISRQLISSYDETAIIFSALILFGLMAMFYLSSYTIKERDEAQELFFKEKEEHIRDQVNSQKENLFTKRIYHTHHKAEKVMGFIKDDLRSISNENIDEVKYRVTKYANFISRVIYDMKWYDPPLQTIRNPIFKTNLNEVIQFLINHIFLRISKDSGRIKFDFQYDENLPFVTVNEFVIWEILEPLIQNSIDHSVQDRVTIQIRTEYQKSNNNAKIFIEDDGKGIREDLLEYNEDGIKRIFMENISTKTNATNSGYGCYLAYEIAKRCKWHLDAENNPKGGSRFILTLSYL